MIQAIPLLPVQATNSVENLSRLWFLKVRQQRRQTWPYFKWGMTSSANRRIDFSTSLWGSNPPVLNQHMNS